MNSLNIIKSFAFSSISQGEESTNSYSHCFTALETLDALIHNNEWLDNSDIAKEVISRLWTIKSKNSEECFKTIALFNKIAFKYNLPPLKQKNMFQELLMKISSNFITILESGAVHVNILTPLQKKQWDCLEKLHHFIPITDLMFTGDIIELPKLLKFLELNPDIVSLYLGNSSNIDDDNLKKMSKNLLKINRLCINSAMITVIPKLICDQLMEINCSKCEFITVLDAPKVTKLTCSSCSSLTIIDAPKAIVLDCNKCLALETILAPNLRELKCNEVNFTTLYVPEVTILFCCDCPQLMSIHAPKVAMLKCSNCKLLSMICAPNVMTLNCNDCPLLTEIDASKVTELYCGGTGVKAINAPNARILTCDCCIALTSLIIPYVIELICSNCDNLKILKAPSVTKLDCRSCYALTIIVAPNALKIDCSSCIVLTTIIAFHIISIDFWRCKALTSRIKLNLFRITYRNIIQMESSNENKPLLSKHVQVAKMDYSIDLKDYPLTHWFIDADDFNIPAEFNSAEDKESCKRQIDFFLIKLLNLVNNEDNFKGIDLEWFLNLKRFNSPQQEMKRIIWLATIFASNNEKKNPLLDNVVFPTITAINELSDPFLQKEASRSLYSIYDTYNETGENDRYILWRSINQSKKSHLILATLFFCSSEIDNHLIEKLLKYLEPSYYKNLKVLNPILEMVCLIFKNFILSKEDQEKIIELILRPEIPGQGSRQSNKDLNVWIAKYRLNQRKWVDACKDLLFFKKEEKLKNIKNQEDLLETHQEFFREFFGVEKALAGKFTKKFKLSRFPNGLFTYAARLQTLPDIQKPLVIEILGKFVNSCLKGEFPNCRYDLLNNPHLTIIFKNNPDLFEKWKAPSEIPLEHIVKQDLSQSAASHIVVKDLMKLAIDNDHLGDKNLLSKEFTDFLDGNGFDAINEIVVVLKNRLESSKTQYRDSKKEIEIDCLNALDSNLLLNQRIQSLQILYDKLDDNLEFKNDVRGIIEKISPSQIAQLVFKSIVSAESWEDFLLMGTEVNNSCQRIDGIPDLNKCLLSYILDGKNKVIIIKNSQGKIVARSVLRILWDEEQKSPVLFMERIYTKGKNSELPNLIRKGCEKIAQDIKLPLVASKRDFPNGLPYKGQLSALGGPAPFEYVDALSGIQENGKFTISNCIFLT